MPSAESFAQIILTFSKKPMEFSDKVWYNILITAARGFSLPNAECRMQNAELGFPLRGSSCVAGDEVVF